MDASLERKLIALIKMRDHRWTSNGDFLVWVDMDKLSWFCHQLTRLFGRDVFAEGGINATLFSNCVCIPLNEFADNRTLENAFPKKQPVTVDSQ